MSSYIGDSTTTTAVNPFVAPFTSQGIDKTISQILSELGQLRVLLYNIVTTGPEHFYAGQAQMASDRKGRLSYMMDAFNTVFVATPLSPSQADSVSKFDPMVIAINDLFTRIRGWQTAPIATFTTEQMIAAAKSSAAGLSIGTMLAVGVGAIAIWFALK